MKNHLRQVRNAVMAVLPFFGRFGSNKDNSPESYMPGVEIEGGGPGKSASRKRNARPDLRKAGVDPDLFSTAERKERLFQAMRAADRRASRIPGSLRGSTWLRNRRRLRSAGF